MNDTDSLYDHIDEILEVFPHLNERTVTPGVVRVPGPAGMSLGIPYDEALEAGMMLGEEPAEHHPTNDTTISAINVETMHTPVEAEYVAEIPWYKQRRTTTMAVVFVICSAFLVAVGISTSSRRSSPPQ
mmetsp:Transcript_18794/g.27871  ORF Transcript_18794/g.27871 Transcript_18794/m.27871 type:complete len:129 (+) Transcript_18794:5678-6064(+)